MKSLMFEESFEGKRLFTRKTVITSAMKSMIRCIFQIRNSL